MEVSVLCDELKKRHLGPLSDATGLLGTVAKIELIPKPQLCDDAVCSFLFADKKGIAIGVAQVSNASAPTMVRRGVYAAADARRILGHRLKDSVLEPVCSSEIDGKSYVVWPWRKPLKQQKWAWWMNRTKIRRSVQDWLRHVVVIAAASDRTAEIRTRYIEMLQYVKQSENFNPSQQHCAEIAMDRLHAGLWQPASILDHNDLWRGNVHWNLDARGRSFGDSRIVIIDWYGANVKGFGFGDLVRWAISSGMPSYMLANEIKAHAEILGIELFDARGHLLATLGRLSVNREQFPLHLLKKTINAMWDQFENAIQ